jgi:hypothetical protein
VPQAAQTRPTTTAKISRARFPSHPGFGLAHLSIAHGANLQPRLARRSRRSRHLPDAERGRPTDRDRAWWLRRYDDGAIAELADALFGVADAVAVASWRVRLLLGTGAVVALPEGV